MPDLLVETKLLPPRSRPATVARPRLGELLLRGSDTPLTLISAPAGFGKTTFLGGWLRAGGGGRPTAWVSLDERDRDASSFWTYVLLAIDRAAPGAATAALARHRSDHVPVEIVLTALLNELSVSPQDLNLVLDDYHLADGPDVHSGMAFLLDHLPPQVHVVISTRADPALPLARLRARGDLVEIRASDLRFTLEEVEAYINDLNALGLASADVAALETRTEGWVAALQLAALSLRGRDDAARFVADFAGDSRFVVDYLADEVLDRQPASVRGFLLDTSVLDRLTGPLCDAVTGQRRGRAMLESLERQNLFVVPLDDHRRWYRYHHLFADVLHAHLLDERPEDVAGLHRRASDWYDQNHDPEPAVRHALAAGDVDRAADLVELAMPSLRRQRREAITRRWADALPADVLKNRPVLAVGLIGALTANNEFDGVDQRLRDVERLLERPADGFVVLDRAEFSRLRSVIETYWAALALVAGDLTGTVQHAERALDRAADDDLLTSSAASALIGLASWAKGDLGAAHRSYRAAANDLARAGHVADVLGCTITLSDIEMTQGRLREAERTVERALTLAQREDPTSDGVRGTADMYVGLSRVAWERGDLAAAAECLNRAGDLGEAAGLPQNPYRWRVAMAHLRAAEGDTATAVGLLEEAERVYVGDFSPDVRPVAAARARMLASAGDAAGALAWARRRGISAGEDLSYVREYEHVTLARVLLADHAAGGCRASLAEATALLDRLLAAAEGGGRAGTVLEVLVLQALARRAAGEQERALVSLERAARLAEPEGYVWVFAGEGAPMVDMLSALDERHRGWGFVRRLLAATLAAVGSRRDSPSNTAPGDGLGAVPGDGAETGRHPKPMLIDPLSSRELDILRFLCSDLDGPAIARELSVSLSTVRTHTQHVYSKLGVNNRRAAVRRAHQLNLFSHLAPR
jgi:LuxR family maltose regulon positive regulatory protein